jgi:hypothetical protein
VAGGGFLNTDDFDRDHARMTAFEDLYGNRWDLLQPART